jgi:hypothetical protein
MKEKKRLDMNNLFNTHIVGCLANMVAEDGLTSHEVFEVLDDIKQKTFYSLSELKKGDANEKR